MSDQAGMEMPKYVCHKEVCALKIGDHIEVHPDGAVTLTIADGGFGTVLIDADVVSRYMPVAGDYYVVYEDGYESISPAKAFEEGYTRK